MSESSSPGPGVSSPGEVGDRSRSPNAEQAAVWDGDEGRHGVEHQARYDSMLRAFTEPLLTASAIAETDRVLDVGFPDLEFWTDLLGRLGLSNGQPEARRAAEGGRLTYRNNCNGGLYVGDRAHWARIVPEWRRAADALPTWMAAPPSWTHYYDQIAFGVACARLGLDVKLLPPRLNFPFHENPPGPLEIQPVLLHHHQSLASGRLRCMPGHAVCPGVLTAVRRVNRVLDRLDWKAFGL